MGPILARVLLGSRVLRRINTLITRSRLYWASRIEKRRREVEPLNLMNFEKRVFSQNGEDGILAEIFRRIGTRDRFFVEIGVGYRFGARETECNTRNLLENDGWSGIWIDASSDFVEDARKRFSQLPVRVLQTFVERETIKPQLQTVGVKPGFDLLSIDIDGNDYWIWKALQAFRPRVVIMEYNGSITPGHDWVMPYNQAHRWDATAYFGASLDAYYRLGQELGYALVGCDSNGINAFFVRKEELGEHFCKVSAGTHYHYVAPKRNPDFYGFPPSIESGRSITFSRNRGQTVDLKTAS
jgi:hypothetical protein